MVSLIFWGGIAYLVGSCTCATLICRWFNLQDPTKEGSKNPGTTNVLRLGGSVPAIITLLGDSFKGALPVLLASWFGGVLGAKLGIVAFMAVVGHVFPLFNNFKGGKGVATAMGAITALSPMVGILVVASWLITALVSRYSSLSAMVSMIVALVLMLLVNGSYFLATLAIVTLVIYRHRENIKRLLAGAESKIEL